VELAGGKTKPAVLLCHRAASSKGSWGKFPSACICREVPMVPINGVALWSLSFDCIVNLTRLGDTAISGVHGLRILRKGERAPLVRIRQQGGEPAPAKMDLHATFQSRCVREHNGSGCSFTPDSKRPDCGQSLWQDRGLYRPVATDPNLSPVDGRAGRRPQCSRLPPIGAPDR